jgi:hypothetical protein
LADHLSSAERAFSIEFIEAGEYGLALETLVAGVVERIRPITEETFGEIVALAEAMDIRSSAITERLTSVCEASVAQSRDVQIRTSTR